MTGPRLSLMVAMDRRGLIGAGGRLPWRLPAEMRWFRRMTLGKPVLMGRRTYQSIKGPLAKRQNLVLTRQPAFVAPGCVVVPSLDAALAAAGAAEEVVVIGGADVYALALPFADRLYLSVVEAELDGDTWFPPVDWRAWQVVWRATHPADADNAYGFHSFILERREVVGDVPLPAA